MSKPPKVKNDVTTVHGPRLWIHELGTPENRFWRGSVFTAQGIVAIYRQIDPDYTDLHFCRKGKWHTRQIAAVYSDQYTITLARRYAEEIAGDA